MSYTHVAAPSGKVHAKPLHSDYTECGKGVTSSYVVDVSDPITCKVCVRSLEVSRDYRVARDLSRLTFELWQDVIDQPGAYSTFASSLIAQLKHITEAE